MFDGCKRKIDVTSDVGNCLLDWEKLGAAL